MIVDARKYSVRGLVAVAASIGAAVFVVGLVGCADTGEDGVASSAAPATASPQATTAAAANGLSIQLLDKPDIAGNVRVTVTNNPISSNAAPPYLVVGRTENPIVLRDDGLGADLVAKDNVYSTFAFVSADDLAKRNSNETNLISSFKIQSVLTFTGRTVSGSVTPVPIEIASFQKLAAIAFNPSGIFSPSSPAPANSLMVTNLNVVGAAGDPTRVWDPCSNTGTQLGAFTFGHLMTEMANQPLTGINPSTFAMQWLKTWTINQTINTFNVPARPNIAAQIINPWLAASGGGSLNLGIAPFRLLAVVNRLDLRTGAASYGGATGNAGELRFVFGAVRPGTTCQLLPFTVIFEYGVPIQGCTNVRSWAQQWVNLSTLALGSPAYNAALQAITDQVVLRNDDPGKPNGSALNQLRTNEIALASPWELRQFNLLSPVDVLHETPVFNTPDVQFNPQDPGWNLGTTFDSYVLSGLTTVPLSFLGAPFQGGAAPVTGNNLGYFWNTSTLDLDPTHTPNWNSQRQLDSLNTCNACHTGETHTQFTHVSPTSPATAPAVLSGFLTGITVADPAFGSPTRTFNDLARRQADLVAVANSVCSRFPVLLPNIAAMAMKGDPLPVVLVSQPVADVSQQGTFLIEDFFKAPIQGH